MKSWYRLNMIIYGSKPRIEPVEIERETEKFVVIAGRRQSKADSYESYHSTWADARDALISRRIRAYESAQEAMRRAQVQLAEAEAIPEQSP